MNRMLVKILLAILMFPSMLVIFVGTLAIFSAVRDEEIMFVAASLAAGGFAVIYWLLLWRDTVQWTPERSTRMVGFSFGAAVLGLGVGGVTAASIGGSDAWIPGMMLGGAVAVVAWLIATVLIWKETPAERAERVRRQGSGTVMCVKCGYNMTGLREPRCPECGTAYTVDELLKAQLSEQADAAITDETA